MTQVYLLGQTLLSRPQTNRAFTIFQRVRQNLSDLKANKYEKTLYHPLTLLTCLFFTSPNVVLSEAMDELEEHEGIWFKKFSDFPSSGKVAEETQGIIKDGKEEGA